MSTTIDQKVVSLQFDNKQFERNTAQTMSTLDRLKEKLHFTGASKGLENVGNAAKNVNMHGLGGAVETVTAKFSALQVMGTTALVNITNSAVNAGKRIAKALTVEPVMSGFKEYETQINATQTILANTQSQGTQLEDVNKALEELNKYADQTIYNFTEMTNNIGKFTAAGVDLQTSVDSIKGIANLAAVSGSTSQQASTAMYQLSQALAAGKVSLMDWNSVVNAGMGGKLFQDALVRTSENLKTGAKDAIATYGSFRESLTKGQWLTTEVLTETLKQLSGAYSETELIAQGFTKSQAAEIVKLADSAVSAATEVKTFTQLWDVLKESAQSGWSQTWKLIIGDFDQAKALLTPLANTLTGFINKMSNARNRLVEGVLNFTKPWTSIIDKLGKADLGLGGIKKVADGIGVAADKVKYFQDVVDKVWRGDFNNWGDNPDRRDLLKQAGYDPKVVQHLVNLGEEAHKAGKTYQITANDVAEAHKKYGIELKTTAEETVEVTNAINNLSDAQLKEAGLTEDEITLYRDLQRESERTGKSIEQLSKEMSETDGRTLLVNSFKNAGSALMDVFRAIGDAWREVFPPMSVVRLYSLIKAFNEFTARIKSFTENHAEQLKNAFKGLFSIVKIITMIFGGAFKIAFKIAAGVIQALGYSIGDIVLTVADAIVRFSEWLESILDIDAIVDAIVPVIVSAGKAIGRLVSAVKDSKGFQTFISYVKKAASAIGQWLKENVDFVTIFEFLGDVVVKVAKAIWQFVTAVKDSKGFQSFISFVKKAGSALGDWFKGLKDAPNVGKYILDGLVNGLTTGIPKVLKAILDVASGLVEAFCEFLGIHSPSKTFIEYGKDIIVGLVLGLWEVVKLLFSTMKEIATGSLEAIKESGIGGTLVDTFTVPLKKIVEFIKGLDLATVLGVAFGGGALIALIKLADALKGFASAIGGFSDMCSEVGAAAKRMSKAVSLNLKAKAVQTFAIAIAILVAAIAGLVTLLEKDAGKVWQSVGIVAIIAGILVGVMIALEKFGSKVSSKELLAQTGAFVGIAASFLILGYALQSLSKIPTDKIWTTIGLFAAIFIALGGMMAAMAGLSKLGLSDNLLQAGGALLAMSVAMLILTKVVEQVSKMKPSDVDNGLQFIIGVSAIFAGLVAISKFSGEHASKAGTMILLMAVAFRLMINVFENVNELEPGAIQKGMNFVTGLSVLFSALIGISGLSGKNASKAGVMILLMAVALRLMVNVMEAIYELEPGALIIGITVIGLFATMFAALIGISLLAGNNAAKAGAMLLMVAGAMVILTLVIYLIGLMEPEKVVVGIVAIGILMILMGALISVTALVDKDCTKVLIILLVAIGLLVAAMIGLSFLDPVGLGVAAGSLSAVVGVFALLIYMTKHLQKVKMGKIIGPLVLLIVVVGLLAAVLTLMLKYMPDASAAIPSAIALGIMAVVMVGVVSLLGAVSGIAKKATKGVVALLLVSAALVLLATAIAIAGKCQNALGAVQALVVLVTVMTLLLFPLALVGMMGMAPIIGIGVLVVLVAAILGLMIGIGALMTLVPGLTQFVTVGISVLIQMATGLGNMITAFVTSVSAGGLLQTLAVFAMLPLLLLGLILLLPLMVVVGALAVGIGALINYFPSIQSFIDTGLPVLLQLAVAIGQMIAAFTTEVSVAGLGDVFAVFLMMPILTLGLTLLLPLIAIIGVVAGAVGALLENFPSIQGFVDTGIPLLVSLAGGLGEMIAAFTTGLLSGLPEIGLLLSQFMVNATPFIMLSKLVDMNVLEAAGILTGAILALTAADLISSITSFLTGGSNLPAIGTELSQFMANAAPFIAAVSAIPNGAMGAVADIASALLLLTAADLVEGITSFFSGESSLEGFAKELPKLGEGITGLLGALPDGKLTKEQVDTLNAVANVTSALAEVASNLPNTGGLLGELVGENDLGPFAEQFPKVGAGIKGMLDALPDGTLTETQIATVDSIAYCVETLAGVAKEIPNTGGLLGELVGNNDLDDFAEMFPKVGAGIKGMLDALPDKTLTSDQVATVESVASCVSTLAEVANEIPNTGGLLGELIGDNALADFAEGFPKVGAGIKGMLDALPDKTLTETQIGTVNAIAGVIHTLASVSQEIPNSGGLLAELVGDDSLEDFAEQFPAVGEGIAGFNEHVVDIDVERIKAATGVFASVAELGALTFDSSGLVSFAQNLITLGTAFAETCAALGTITDDDRARFRTMITDLGTVQHNIDATNMNGDAAAINNLANAMHNVASIGADAGDGLRSSLDAIAGANFKTVGEESIADLISGMDAMTDEAKTKLTGVMADVLTHARDDLDYVGRFKDFGVRLIEELGSGIAATGPIVNSKFAKLLSSCITDIRDNRNYPGKFRTLGIDIVNGLVGGMTASKYLVTSKGAEIAKALEDKIREELEINSPSKVFARIGMGVPEGLALGIDKFGNLATASAKDMTNNTIGTVSSSISKISDMVNSGIDAQPTIRPVMDLSDVEAGASRIGGLLNTGSSMRVVANANGISSMMMGYRQNRGNDEVVSELAKLRKDIGSMDRPTYNINGITYDDGSNISDAVQTLIRAARVGRRT